MNETKLTSFEWNPGSLHVCEALSGSHPIDSQMGVCEEDYYCKPALPTHAVSKTYIHKTHFQHRPTFILDFVPPRS